MKRIVLLFTLQFLFFNAFAQSGAQSKPDPFSKQYKNSVQAGISLAVSDAYGSKDGLSLFYKYEYIHGVSRLFSLGLGMGFFNEQKVPTATTFSDGYVFEEYDQTSVMSINLTGYVDVIKTRRSLLRFGAGYTGRFTKILYTPITYFGDVGVLRAASIYERVKAFESGALIHLEYGYRTSPHLRPSFSVNIYSKGKYTSFFMAGFNISYCF